MISKSALFTGRFAFLDDTPESLIKSTGDRDYSIAGHEGKANVKSSNS
jgi:hypothetical protein